MKMNKRIREIAEKAGFVFWENEEWGPGPDKIDWSADYEREFELFVELLVDEIIDVTTNQKLKQYYMKMFLEKENND